MGSNAYLRTLLLAGTVAIAVVNGLPVTSFFDSVSYILFLFSRRWAFLDQDLLFYLTTVAIAVMTLLVAGIPAALYERLRGHRHSTAVSLGIWPYRYDSAPVEVLLDELSRP